MTRRVFTGFAATLLALAMLPAVASWHRVAPYRAARRQRPSPRGRLQRKSWPPPRRLRPPQPQRLPRRTRCKCAKQSQRQQRRGLDDVPQPPRADELQLLGRGLSRHGRGPHRRGESHDLG